VTYLKTLRTGLVVLSILLISVANGYSKPFSTFNNITTNQSLELILKNRNNPEFIIVDLRTDGELKQGIIENAIQLDFMKPGFIKKLRELDKSKTYLLYCQSGYRSEKTFNIMSRLYFKTVYNMTGGFKRWNFLGYPIEN
jgi:rhodanese-related sulfurtransferase